MLMAENSELADKLANMEISEIESGVENSTGNKKRRKIEIAQTVSSNNDSVFPLNAPHMEKLSFLEFMKAMYYLVRKTHTAVVQLFTSLEDFSKQEIRKDKDYRSRFDAMYAKYLETGSKVPSRNETEPFEIKIGPHEVRPGDLVLILDPTLFEKGEGQASSATEDWVNAVQADVVDEKAEQNQSLDVEMDCKEQETETPTQSGMRVLEIESKDHKAKHLNCDGTFVHRKAAFYAVIDVSLFDAENIICRAGEGKLEIHARVSRQNEHGSVTHEINQVYQVPAIIDMGKFIACINKSVLHVSAPMRHKITVYRRPLEFTLPTGLRRRPY